MADIRYTAQIDDFERADENPIDPPWVRNWTSGINCKLGSGAIGSTSVNPAQSAQSFWETESWTGNEIEAWAEFSGSVEQADSSRMGLADDAAGMNGYILRCENPVGTDEWVIRKYTGGSASEISAANHTPPVDGSLVCMQLTATLVNCYYSTDAGANWTLVVSAADSAYRSGLFVHLGANGGEPGWEAVGAGVPSQNRTQIYRWIKN
jgi:hypothetical protein